MAKKSDESFLRRREREQEEEEEQQISESPSKGTAPVSEKLDELIQRAEPMIEQVDHLYNMYISGAEKIPPTERRKQLDQLMQTLQLMSKPTPAASFRYNSIYSRYVAYRDRWDKTMKDLEKGKQKRRVPGKY